MKDPEPSQVKAEELFEKLKAHLLEEHLHEADIAYAVSKLFSITSLSLNFDYRYMFEATKRMVERYRNEEK